MASDDGFRPGRRGWLKEKADAREVVKSYYNQGNRLSALRFILAGGAPGMWASNHLEELQHCTGWNFVAANAFALQMAGAKVQAYAQPKRRRALGRTDPDSIEGLQKRLDRLLGRRTKSFDHGQGQDAHKLVPLPAHHQLVKLMRRPNPDQSGAVWRYQIGQQLALTSTALIWVIRDNVTTYDDRGTPREMYVIPSGLALPMPPSTNYPEGYYRVLPLAAFGIAPDQDGFQPTGSIGSLLSLGGDVDRRDVRAIRWPHPIYSTDSLSPLSAGAVMIDIAEKIDQAIWARMNNGARPGLVFSWDSIEAWQAVPKEERDAFRSDLKANNAGPQNVGRDMMTPPGMKADAFESTAKEADFVGTRPQFRDSVLAMHQTPATVAGATEATSYAQLFASFKQYTEFKVQPSLDMIFEELGEDLTPAYGPGHVLEAKARSIEDPTLTAQRLQRLQTSKVVTNDEYRALEGLGPHPDPEIGKMPVGQTAPNPPPAPGGAPGGALSPGPGAPPLTGAQDKDKQGAETTGLSAPANPADAGNAVADIPLQTKAAAVFDRPPLAIIPQPVVTPKKAGVALFVIPQPWSATLAQLGRLILPAHLAEKGVERDPHVTCLYGLSLDDPALVYDVVRDFGPVQATFGQSSLFQNDEHHVLKVDVQSDDLHRLNKLLRDSLPHLDEHPEFNPHATVAFLKPGASANYVGWKGLEGEKLTFDQLVFSDRYKQRHVLPLTTRNVSVSPFRSKAFDPLNRPDKMLAIPDVEQHDNFSCGAAASMAVGAYFGVGPKTLEEWKKALGTDVERSTNPKAIVDYLRSLGLQVEPRQDMTLDDLSAAWQAGRPVICPIQDYGQRRNPKADFLYGHYVVVAARDLGMVFVQDSSADNVLKGSDSDAAPGKGMIDEATWLRVWHDKDADGNVYRNFGIVVGPPQPSLAEKASAELHTKAINAAAAPAMERMNAEWLAEHALTEKQIATAANTFLNEQAQQLKQTLRAQTDAGVHPTVAGAFDTVAFATGMRQALLPHLEQAAARGALFEFDNHAAANMFDAYEQAVIDQAKQQTEHRLDRKYWLFLSNLVHDDLQNAAAKGQANGLQGRALADHITGYLGGAAAVERAGNIGATEGTYALGTGQEAGRKVLADLGAVLTKTWWCRMDGKERASHHEAHKQTVPIGDKFLVGKGETADYPGDMTLSAGERCGCRCKSLSGRVIAPNVFGKGWEKHEEQRAFLICKSAGEDFQVRNERRLDDRMRLKGFTGTITASNGVMYHYVDGVRVASNQYQAHVQSGKSAKPNVKVSPAVAKQHVANQIASGNLDHDAIAGLHSHLSDMDVHDLRDLAKQHGATIPQNKHALVESVQQALAAKGGHTVVAASAPHVAALVGKISNPAALTAADIASLPADLAKLNITEVQELKRLFGVKSGATKPAIIAAIAQHISTIAGQHPAGPAAAPTPAAPTPAKASEVEKKFFSEFDKAPNLEAAAKVLAKHATPQGMVEIHGMSRPEKMVGITVSGVQFSWSEAAAEQAAMTLQMLLGTPDPSLAKRHAGIGREMPKKLWDATTEAAFSTQQNKYDPYWAEQYSAPNFVSNASGGGGSVTVYNNKAIGPSIFAHECGHNLAEKLWGSTFPPPDSEYGKMQAVEGPVSDYATKSPAEDFAEACTFYFLNPSAMRLGFPKKFKALEDLLGNEFVRHEGKQK